MCINKLALNYEKGALTLQSIPIMLMAGVDCCCDLKTDISC